MDALDRWMLLIIIVCCCIFSGVAAYSLSADFTCKQLGGVRIDNQCVQAVKDTQ